ncbi:MAG: hypothetical protein IJZ25_00935 [Lachnospiraceae bacterium]|nr:hypothetical protein [Lachnospiraceae bacterium]
MNEWISKLKGTLNPGILVMLAAGIMLLLISCSTEENTENRQTGGMGSFDDAVETTEPTDETELVAYYENKLENLLTEVEGIGHVSIMLSPDMDGACILCEGAGDVEVQSDIIDICGSLFGIPAHKVQILEIKKENDYDG